MNFHGRPNYGVSSRVLNTLTFATVVLEVPLAQICLGGGFLNQIFLCEGLSL